MSEVSTDLFRGKIFDPYIVTVKVKNVVQYNFQKKLWALFSGETYGEYKVTVKMKKLCRKKMSGEQCEVTMKVKRFWGV